MSSLQSHTKQIPLNNGYYITLGDIRGEFYQNYGTDAAPLMSTINYSNPVQPQSSIIAAAGGTLRDHGVTLVSSGRVFRKVQVMAPTGPSYLAGTDGVAGNVSASGLTPSYLTGFIELPGTGGYSSGTGSVTAVARLG